MPDPKEKVRVQLMPAPDEAPLTCCPWCGAEYNCKEDDSSKFYEDIDRENQIYRHKKCGKLVRFVGTGADSE